MSSRTNRNVMKIYIKLNMNEETGDTINLYDEIQGFTYNLEPDEKLKELLTNLSDSVNKEQPSEFITKLDTLLLDLKNLRNIINSKVKNLNSDISKLTD